VQKQAVIGVDPHKRVVTAVAWDHRGGWLGEWRGKSSRQAIGELRAWADSLTREATWAIEGTNFLGRRIGHDARRGWNRRERRQSGAYFRSPPMTTWPG
jgi:hypothetical protein